MQNIQECAIFQHERVHNLASFVVFFWKVILRRTEVKSQFFRKQEFVLLSMDKQAIKVWLLIPHLKKKNWEKKNIHSMFLRARTIARTAIGQSKL